MKARILIAAFFLSVTATAGATDRGRDETTINQGGVGLGVGIGVGVGVGQGGAGGLGGAGGIGGAGGSVGNVTGGSITQNADYDELRIVPPAIAPSINTNVICPMVMQGSKAGSVFFFSGSGTHAPDIVPLCVAWHLGQKDVVERITCQASKAYREANPSCEVQ